MDEALATVEDAVESELLWRTARLANHDLDPIRDHPRFRASLARVEARLRDHREPARLVVEGEGTRVVVLLHGATSNATEQLKSWRPALALGYRLAAVQSSQPAAPGLFHWDDPEIARQDVLRHFAELDAGDSVILSGFSQGGRLALDLVLERVLHVAKYVLICPSIPQTAIDHYRGLESPTAGVILVGDADPWSQQAEAVARMLGAEIEVIDGLGHDFPPDFDKRLPRLLKS